MWQEFFGAHALRARVAAGELVFRAGQAPRTALVVAGVVRVFTWTAAGTQLTIRYAQTDDLIGLAPALSGIQMWNAEAITDTTLATLTIEKFHGMAARDPQILWRVAEHVATWAADAVTAAADTGFQPMTVRVARHLREVALRTPEGRLVAHTSHQRLADAVGTAREVVSRELRTLRVRGVIDTQRMRVIVRDQKRLERIAAGEF
jgi:CRP-like cAMP-binding protein